MDTPRCHLVVRIVAPSEGGSLVPGTLLYVRSESASVGRGGQADVVLPDPSVSRLHARFVVDDGAVRIERLTPHNAIFVDGVAVEDAAILPAPDATVQLGGLLLAVHDPAAETDRTTAHVETPRDRQPTDTSGHPRWRVVWDAQICTVSLDGRTLALPPLVAAFLGTLLETPNTPMHQWDLLERLGPRTNLNQCATLARRAIRERVEHSGLSAEALLEAVMQADDARVDPEDLALLMKRLIGNQRGYGYVARVGHMGVDVEHR